MASGVQVSDNVKTKFSEMKMQKHIKIMVMKIDDESKEVEVTETVMESDLADKNAFKVFVERMEDTQCCYIVYDCSYETPDSPKNELVFVMWTPDSSSVKQKMLYASSKDNIKKIMIGVNCMIEMNDRSDHSLEYLAGKLKKEVTSIEGQPLQGAKKSKKAT